LSDFFPLKINIVFSILRASLTIYVKRISQVHHKILNGQNN
jgi:hypothetical protein